MKSCTRCNSVFDLSAFSRNLRRADGMNAWCRGCTSEYNKAYNASRRGEAAARVAEWRKNNPDARKREYVRNAESVKARAKAWQLANPAKRRMFWANYRAQRINATPAWADKAAIARIYAACTALNKLHGPASFHVDHIVPLNHELVCGLHTPENLRVIPADENRAKSNLFA